MVAARSHLFSSPGQSPGRAIVLPPALAAASVLANVKVLLKVFYVMGKALSGELSCPCDRFCYLKLFTELQISFSMKTCCDPSLELSQRGSSKLYFPWARWNITTF